MSITATIREPKMVHIAGAMRSASIVVELGNGLTTKPNPSHFPEAYELAAKMMKEGWRHTWVQIWWSGRGSKKKGQLIIELHQPVSPS